MQRLESRVGVDEGASQGGCSDETERSLAHAACEEKEASVSPVLMAR